MKRIAVLASGGLDSSVLVADLARTAEVFPIYIQCGLLWEAEEREALEAFLAALKNPRIKALTTLSVSVGAMYRDHWSMSGERIPGLEEPDSAVYLPGRNILLIGLAAVWCSTHGVSRIAIGSLSGNPFPDARPEFFRDFSRALSTGLNYQVQVEAPYRNQQKSEILSRFSELPLELTLTCMNPKGGWHCGRCNKCGERKLAFQQARVADRTRYLS